MNFELIFLGTSAAVPSPSRGHSSIAIKYFDEILLFDCGEGTQRQLIRSGTSYMKIKKIFISHYHGDHFLGLPGLLQTMSLAERSDTLYLYGPRGIHQVLRTILDICNSDLSFRIEPIELKDGSAYECEIYCVSAVKVDHSALTFGFIFEEVKGREFILEKALKLGLKPGPVFSKLKRGEKVEFNGKTICPDDVLGKEKHCKKIIYTSDTRPSERVIKESKGAILIHDSTYDDDLKEQALEATHSTCVEAAEVANKGGAKKLFLNHISPRYTDTTVLQQQARKVFRETFVARDLLKIKP